MRLARQINLAILTTLLLVISLVGVLTYLGVRRGFAHYVRSLEEARLEPASRRLTELYARDGSWEALRRDPRRFGGMLRAQDDVPPEPAREHPPPADDAPPPRPREGPDRDPLELPPRVTLYDARGARVVGPGSADQEASRLPLVVEGETVGWLGIRAIPRFDEQLDLRYFEQVRGQLLLITAAGLALGLITAALLTRRILRPIDALTAGARRMTSGDYEARIDVDSDDELGLLARDFDSLAGTLAADRLARRQWVADTSHELRTPITVLRAEVEAMLDGVRPLQVASLASLHGEILRLAKLVDDLGELARTDRGELTLVRAPVLAVEALRESIAAVRTRLALRRVHLEVELTGAEAAFIDGDRARLQQIFANLLENSVRYTDPGGSLRVSAALDGRQLRMTFDDSAPAAPAHALPLLFERFYRADPSRSREHGGSGLGLAICKRLVELHDGQIAAANSALGGLRIELTFPVSTANVAPPTIEVA